MSHHDHPVATSTDFAFVNTLLSFSEEGREPRPGDTILVEDSYLTPAPGAKAPPGGRAQVESVTEDTVVLRSEDDGRRYKIQRDSTFGVDITPELTAELAKHERSAIPDGVAFSDTIVPTELTSRLREHVARLAATEPVDHHPGSGTRVRDLVHPSLYPYVQGVSPTTGELPDNPAPTLDRFGRTFESSRYQWLPTPFRIDADGTTTIDGYINNLDASRYGALQADLAELFTSVLPLVEGVLGYVDATRFWKEELEGIEHEGELPEVSETTATAAAPVPPRSVRGRELQVIPKIVEYHLKAGEVHEGVWHVEGMSHEHIVATCVYVLDRDQSLRGGDLSFKRAYTVEEAGRLFWNIGQSRPRVVDRLVDEGTIPLGSVATPMGRALIFPNSHIHKLNALTVARGESEGKRQVIVFWIVDPDVRIVSTREVPPQQASTISSEAPQGNPYRSTGETLPGSMSRADALRIRLDLMEERRLHKASFNPRTVSLCEH